MYRHRCFLYSIVCLVLLLAPLTAHGFGPTGHRVVGRIAEFHLNASTKRALAEILKAESLPEASTWPDEIRSDPNWDHSQTWHYVTIEDGESYATSKKNPAGDVVEAIDRFVGVLQKPTSTRKEKVIAIRWLVHLVADVHQPLHVGRGADQGGNLIKTEWFGEETNLHHLWDSDLIESTKLSFSEYALFINKASEKQIHSWQQATVGDWVKESIKYRKRVYQKPEPGIGGSYQYAFRNLPFVELRMQQAGVRLAGLLNSVLGPQEAKEKQAEISSLNSTLWVQRSEEYIASTTAAFQHAKRLIDVGLATPKWTAIPSQVPRTEQDRVHLAELPAAIVLDVDETVLDNSPYAAWRIKNNKPFRSETWNRWVADHQAQAIPGAVSLIDHARARGVAVFYVTNRDFKGDLDANRNGVIEPQEKSTDLEPFTIQNLKDVGLLPPEVSDGDALLLKGEQADWISEKVNRRRWISDRYRVLLLLGDSLGDFAAYQNRDIYEALTADERRSELQKHRHRWGKTWIQLPNPTYGKWLPPQISQRMKELNAWSGPVGNSK